MDLTFDIIVKSRLLFAFLSFKTLLFIYFDMPTLFQVQAPDLSASAPAVGGGGGGIDVEGAMPSVDVGLPSASASLDVPGERDAAATLDIYSTDRTDHRCPIHDLQSHVLIVQSRHDRFFDLDYRTDHRSHLIIYMYRRGCSGKIVPPFFNAGQIIDIPSS